MLYGDEKLREMGRSILPSTWRGARRALRRCKRRHRRKVNMALGQVLRDPDGELPDDLDPRSYPDHEIRSLVCRRQAGDKLNHFQRWAVAYTKDMGADPSGRLARVRSHLPDNLIGWHACVHLVLLEEFATDPTQHRGWGPRRAAPQRSPELLSRILRRVWEDADLSRLLAAEIRRLHSPVRWIVGYGERIERRELRRPEGSRWRGPRVSWHLETHLEEVGPGPRLLRGIDDIDPFLDDLERARLAPERLHDPSRPWVHKRLQVSPGADGELRFTIVEHRIRSRDNPDHHPEWSRALEHFVTCYLAAGGSAHETQRRLRWRQPHTG